MEELKTLEELSADLPEVPTLVVSALALVRDIVAVLSLVRSDIIERHGADWPKIAEADEVGISSAYSILGEWMRSGATKWPDRQE